MKYKIFAKLMAACFMLLLASCSTYHRASLQAATVNYNTLTPKYISEPDGRIEYYQFGHGSPVIFIPGYATDITSWNRYFLAVIAEQHQIILINNRNVGGSSNHSHSYRSVDLANDIYKLVAALQLQKPAIVGISMGGMIAQQYAILHPDAIGHLILINTSIAGNKAIYPDPAVEAKLVNLPKNKLGFYASAVEYFFPPQARVQAAYSLAADRFLPRQYTEIDAGAVMPQQRRLVMSWLHNDAAAKKLRKLAIPVLILNGESDIVIPPKNSEILAATFPNAKLVRWRQGGHAMIYQHPEELGSEIDKFLAR